ncbi:phosphotransferase [Microbacterium sp. zg-YB36]|uniref:maltokinase N-terminal cap-like domain-containing protein n=1 Tax=Microbacterium sp. zg-YB36 TaxID=2969407 RepID=UPI00214C0E32|nr:phosphotransferase [Microbacterium sp. zg-YB36]MDL5350591.1 phosphotransferase [Microbacterium sp. zg-YB36]
MDSTLACLAAWMPRQRWYAAKGRTLHLRYIASWDIPTAEPGVRVRTLLVVDEGALPAVVYQVPLVARATSAVSAAAAAHIIGHPEPGTTLIDGPHDPAYCAALLGLVTAGGTARGPRTVATGRPVTAASYPASATADHQTGVVTGEQSNTSIVFHFADDTPPVICKLFRQVQPGLNPDIELNTALSDARSPHVPRAVGWLACEWPDTATSAGAVTGSLAFAQEFFPSVEDAWRVALRSAAHGVDFGQSAYDLGAATADVHRSLAHVFPAAPASTGNRAALRDAWQRRLATAIAEVRPLAEARQAIEAVYDRALEVDWPPLQRIHGDYHLGQVVLVPDRGWVLLDFEGEPLRAMTERMLPDLALRDVAGMLRSFDYVAGSIRLDHPDRSAAVRDWARVAREGFLAGYSHRAGSRVTTTGPLLDALELDKAVYEATYESRSRPTWVTIPLRAIERLVAAPAI